MEMGGELVWQWTVTQRAPRYQAAVALIFEKLLSTVIVRAPPVF